MVNFKDRYDVAIVGAGPAGSSAAIRLASGGLSVLLLEKAKFPREKLCGEFISPECLSHFEELGVLDEMLSAGGTQLKETVFYGRNGNSVSIKSSWFSDAKSAALSLSRGEMDLRLLNRARAVGVDVREETSVSGLLTENTKTIGLKIKGKPGTDTELFANITIDATGRNRVLARRFDPDEPRRAAKYVAFKTHLRGCPSRQRQPARSTLTRAVTAAAIESRTNSTISAFIASATLTKRLGSDPERVMREMVCANSRAADVLRDAVIAKPWIAVPVQGFGRSTLVPAEGLITVGDAAAFIDPFTGSGMLMALESGRIASEAILASTGFSELIVKYQNAYSAAFDRRLRVCSMIRHVAFVPFLAESTISLLSFSTALRRRLARATRFNARPVS